MELVRGQHNLRACHHGCCVSIGNFDGVHLGHRTVVKQLVNEARRRNRPSCVVTFEPHPREYFESSAAPARLSRVRDKVAQLSALAIDRLLVLRFDRRLVEQEPSAFIDDFLCGQLGVEHVVVGDDFRFGRQRGGDFNLLQAAGTRRGFSVETAATCQIDGERVSSTRVRAALAALDLDEAQRLLGGPYTMRGRVVHGEKLGRDLGYPTANIRVDGHKLPLSGVFAVIAWDDHGRRLPGVASLGWRPTVGGTLPLLEVHAFDFSGDLYGAHLTVELLAHLRPEERFASLDELVERMHEDAREARMFLEKHAAGVRDRAGRNR